MEVLLLGTAAGGGFPQWNCWCQPCRVARAEPDRAHPRTQSSAAVSADGERWFLLNASPDVRLQLGRLNGRPASGIRHVPVEGLILTDAELDHTMGIALLREARHLQLYATEAVLTVLREDSRLLPVTQAFAEVRVSPLPLDTAMPLRLRDGSAAGLEVTAFGVAGDPPRFSRNELPGHTVGLAIRDLRSGSSAAFIPGCGAWDASLTRRLENTDAVFFDGTFWTDDELTALKISDRSAREMGHLPISSAGGSLERLATLRCRHRVYTHINNSNPMLIEDSAERRAVDAAGVVVGDDGMRFSI
jgi:pyrroloquinoline quinone biosynthesis protein B